MKIRNDFEIWVNRIKFDVFHNMYIYFSFLSKYLVFTTLKIVKFYLTK